ncbi:hypothetical protein EWM64_g10129 [Hericium alpestre]|uniref:laccase n=1 Tax=Hericium alpestre TaxID=135208 RepID=A0A4Y9ZJ22_9AGAM|nr:hypothetical protein EWM64_g10129 [Hericium alpestre]
MSVLSNYWMCLLLSAPIAQITDSGVNSTILHYQGMPHAEPATKQHCNINLNLCHCCASRWCPHPWKPKYSGVDKSIHLEQGLPREQCHDPGTQGAHPAADPEQHDKAAGPAPVGSIYDLQRNQTVDVTILGGVLTLPHLIHLHRHLFYVVKSAGNSSFNFENPVLCDTVMMGTEEGNDVVIRFVADNPGPWIIHCGFAAVLAEDIKNVARDQDVPESWKQLCPTYDAFKNETQGQ